MPLIDVTYDGTLGEEVLHRLAEILPDAVAEAVDRLEEPWIGPPGPGDIAIRFRKKSQLDVGDLDVVIEVRTKQFEHRVQDKQRRVNLIRDRPASLPLGQVGVWLILCEGAWSQRLDPTRRGLADALPGSAAAAIIDADSRRSQPAPRLQFGFQVTFGRPHSTACDRLS
jgi:hypothetical protein